MVAGKPDDLKAAADGAYCRLVQRRLSGLISPVLARRFGPNMVTTFDLIVGVAAAACILVGQLLAGGLLIQVFGVLSCSDGEVARIRAETSAIGDFYDTMTDRIVEMALIIAIAVRLYSSIGAEALWVGLLTLAGALLLAVSSEKFHSAFGVRYLKAHWEKPFIWISAGSDARMLVLTVILVMWAAWGPGPALVVAWVLVGAIGLNLVARGYRVKSIAMGGSS
ncbi:CDP-alcohol phosphatidyltransferase family protein [Kutzneria sp. CA-103260]|uniref:CDP-alcohol phosphatidyltransferase family protein n=1 Tax=Kutzneria sp. CA-103260 TaxID=2802641 RepID=UPI001BA7FF1C|nr:CDP-alcohol phosphatidyltransferase family protein [Kutzneria sp. CA-103260]QUQ65402.1 CDP-alcohol phosphatidyltransferase [Kutzneria sp. CA-103260]